MAKSYEGRVRGLGTSHDGLHHWTAQRLTAMANIPLILGTIVLLIMAAQGGYAEARAFVGQPLVAAWFGLTLVVAFYHASLGLQVVIEDYISSNGSKVLMLFLVRFVAALLTVVALTSLISLV